VNGRNGAPVVGDGEEEVGKLLDSVGKLGVGPIGVVGGRRRVLHGEQKAAAGGGSSALVGELVRCTRNSIGRS
jgi:hypothetical protein